MAGDRRAKGEVVHDALEHAVVGLHTPDRGSHLGKLGDHLERILAIAVQRQPFVTAPEVEFELDLLVFLLGDELFVVHLLAARVNFIQPLDPVIHVSQLLAQVERVLLHPEADIFEAVDLLDALGVGADQAQLQVVVRQAKQGVSFLDRRAFQDVDFLDASAIDGVEEDRRQRQHVARDGDVFLERPAHDGGDGDFVPVDVEPPAAGGGRVAVGEHGEERQDRHRHHDALLRPHLFLEPAVESFARGVRRAVAQLRGEDR